MDTPTRKEPDAPEERKGLSKYVSRMKTILKRKNEPKRLSGALPPPPPLPLTPLTPTAGPSSATPREPEPANPTGEVVEKSTAPAEPRSTPGVPKPTEVLRCQIDAERARKLNERFNLEIDPSEWTTIPHSQPSLRVEKPIRMRIHRSCHKCLTTFGANKVCITCQHTRCNKCPRYPPKRSNSEGNDLPGPPHKDHKERMEVDDDDSFSKGDRMPMSIPSKTGGQPLVRKRPMQRVRRNCHKAKKRKYPDGYPGDAPSPTSTAPLKFVCHICNNVFPPIPHPSSPEALEFPEKSEPPKCSRCEHVKCEFCPRAPPRKVEPEPDPEVVKSVESKLAAFAISHPAISSR
ncbi:hypothetical protein B7494_g6653 [Chlorociboria aeruginascens]|nr:hypothetical protein B7494_g6653 [Chlorociboria aeruginascens]